MAVITGGWAVADAVGAGGLAAGVGWLAVGVGGTLQAASEAMISIDKIRLFCFIASPG